jgi:hypothetical protein
MSELTEPADGLSDLTTIERDLLAHLTVLTIQSQLKTPWRHSYDRVADALGEIANDGEVDLVGNDRDVWVYIRGRVIVHAARDWLRWQALQVERHEARN